jgi:hypothetical protein
MTCVYGKSHPHWHPRESSTIGVLAVMGVAQLRTKSPDKEEMRSLDSWPATHGADQLSIHGV